MTPADIIECAIGLFDDHSVPRAKRPPALAAAILAELDQHGWALIRPETAENATPCGCGRFAFSRHWQSFEHDGLTHRPSEPCYRTVTRGRI